MDIRIASYNTGSARPVNLTTFSKPGSPMATTYVQNAAQSGPVPAVDAISASRTTQSSQTGSQIANGGGYTDSVRGSIINILA